MSCPTTWTVGPFRGRDGVRAWRDDCPVCGVTGIRSTDRILAFHP